MEVNTKLIFEDKINPINGISSKFKVMVGNGIYCEFIPDQNHREKFNQHFVIDNRTYHFRITTKNFKNMLMDCCGVCYYDGRLSVLGHSTNEYYDFF